MQLHIVFIEAVTTLLAVSFLKFLLILFTGVISLSLLLPPYISPLVLFLKSLLILSQEAALFDVFALFLNQAESLQRYVFGRSWKIKHAAC